MVFANCFNVNSFFFERVGLPEGVLQFGLSFCLGFNYMGLFSSSDVCQNATRYKCHKQLDQLMVFRCEMRKAQDPIGSGHAR